MKRRFLVKDVRLLPAPLRMPVHWLLGAEESCFDIVASLRWPQGEVVCIHCGNRRSCYITTTQQWKCLSCRKEFSVRAGTIFEDSRLPLRIWLIGLWITLFPQTSVRLQDISAALGIDRKSVRRILSSLEIALNDASSMPRWRHPYFGGPGLSQSLTLHRHRCLRWIDEIGDLFGQREAAKFFRSLRGVLAYRA
jgi:transposase-like protein